MSCSWTSVAQRRDVVGVVDPRHERVGVGVVERRRQLVDVGRDRARSRALERGDDVDALSGAREEDAAHGRREYRRAVLRRLLLVLAALVAAWLVACLVLFVWPPGEAGAPTHADVVVVLSGDRKRLAPGLALIQRGVAPVLAISTVGADPALAHAVAAVHGGSATAAARVLCFDAVPYSTQGEARTIARPRARERLALGRRRHVDVPRDSREDALSPLLPRPGSTSSARRSTWWRLPDEWASETGKLLVQLTVQRGC